MSSNPDFATDQMYSFRQNKLTSLILMSSLLATRKTIVSIKYLYFKMVKMVGFMLRVFYQN